MKVLFISDDIGVTAPGIVASKIYKELCKNHDVFAMTAEVSKQYETSSNITIIPKTSNRHVITNSIKWFGFDILSSLWSLKCRNTIPTKVDFIFVVVSMFHYSPLSLGIKSKKLLSCPLIINAVDAIPAPLPYKMNSIVRIRTANYIKRLCKEVDIIYSTCHEMSLYQRSIIQNVNILYKELFNPSNSAEIINYPRVSRNPVFLYTGNLYYPRNPDYLLKAFFRIKQEFPESRLVFVGTSKSFINERLSALKLDVASGIDILGFQEDLSNLYAKAWALIDIGCEVENDIYLSSKVTSYLSIAKPIICEASNGTASVRLFSRMDTILLCEHSEYSIFNAMKKVIEKKQWDYAERGALLEQMSAQGVVNTIIKDYQKIKHL